MSNPNPVAIAMPSRGGYTRSNPPTYDQLQQFNPNRPGSLEVIWQPQYDYQTYAQAGQTQLLFFQIPQGQSSKTAADTSMVLAGQFPAPTGQFVTAVQSPFFPLNTVSQAASAASRVQTNISDVVAVANSGYLQMVIGSKPYLTDAPIGKFPPNFGIDLFSAMASDGSGTATGVADVNYARAKGRYAEITPFFIPQTQNFQVGLYWPTAVAVTVAGRIGVILDGFYYRQSQ
jgi:hypothetical protein